MSQKLKKCNFIKIDAKFIQCFGRKTIQIKSVTSKMGDFFFGIKK